MPDLQGLLLRGPRQLDPTKDQEAIRTALQATIAFESHSKSTDDAYLSKRLPYLASQEDILTGWEVLREERLEPFVRDFIASWPLEAPDLFLRVDPDQPSQVLMFAIRPYEGTPFLGYGYRTLRTAHLYGLLDLYGIH